MEEEELKKILDDYAKSKKFSGYKEMVQFSKIEKEAIDRIKTALENAGFSVNVEGIVGEKSIFISKDNFEFELFEA